MVTRKAPTVTLNTTQKARVQTEFIGEDGAPVPSPLTLRWRVDNSRVASVEPDSGSVAIVAHRPGTCLVTAVWTVDLRLPEVLLRVEDRKNAGKIVRRQQSVRVKVVRAKLPSLARGGAHGSR